MVSGSIGLLAVLSTPSQPVSRRRNYYLDSVGAHASRTCSTTCYYCFARPGKYHETTAAPSGWSGRRIPLPGWPEAASAAGAADALAASAARGRQLAALLDSDTPVAGVTQGTLRPELAAIAVPTTMDGGNMAGDDFAVSAGWGHFGTGEAVMPGQGKIVERNYADDERIALADAIPTLGDTTFDVYLNDRAYWRDVPAAVWNYQLGGYQVLKKVALLSGAQGSGSPAAAGRGAALY